MIEHDINTIWMAVTDAHRHTVVRLSTVEDEDKVSVLGAHSADPLWAIRKSNSLGMNTNELSERPVLHRELARHHRGEA